MSHLNFTKELDEMTWTDMIKFVNRITLPQPQRCLFEQTIIGMSSEKKTIIGMSSENTNGHVMSSEKHKRLNFLKCKVLSTCTHVGQLEEERLVLLAKALLSDFSF